MTTETTTPEELAAEVERLRAKNAELLGELKAAKNKASENVAELENLRDELLEHKLHRPVAKVLAGVLTGKKYAENELRESFSFELNEAGEIEMRDVSGEPVQISVIEEGRTVTRPIKMDEQEILTYLKKLDTFGHIIKGSAASGGGAPGASYKDVSAPRSQPQSQAKGGFGLR